MKRSRSQRIGFPWRGAAREACAILGAACLLGVVSNAFRPDGVAWRHATGERRDPDFEWLDLAGATRIVQGRERVVLDARSEAAWRTGRLPGALPLPVDRAEEALEHLRPLLADPDERLLVYCGRVGCDESIRLARFLLDQGYRSVSIFPGGLDAWRAAGLPVERTDAHR